MLFTIIQGGAPLLAATYQAAWQRLTPAVQRSWFGRQAEARLKVLAKRPDAGQPAPAFTLPDTAGVAVSLATFRGRYVLLDFWGHWCKACLADMPKLHDLHTRYQQVAFLGIAYEPAQYAGRWKQAIRQYQVPSRQLSELQGGDGPMMQRYNVEAYPTFMLLNQRGLVLLRTSSLEEVEQKLAALPGR